MTVLAHVRRQWVRRALAGCIRAVVTTEAVVDDSGVVEVRRNPGHGRMAVVAVIATCNMCRILASRGRAVVTREAGTDDLQVINDISWFPYDVVVAVCTNVRR